MTARESRVREAELRERIRDVYAVFRRYPLADVIEPDSCFPGLCDDRPLRAAPLQELSPAAFEGYLGKAVTTWGTVDDFKHFLPRMLELVATETDDGLLPRYDLYRVFGKLKYAEWRKWRRKEQEALDAYFEALWIALLARPYDPADLSWGRQTLAAWLSNFAAAHDNLAPFFALWEAEAANPNTGLLPVANLAQDIVSARATLLKKGHLDGYFERGSQRLQMQAWLASDVVSKTLEAAFLRWPDSPYSALISEAQQFLGVWRGGREAGA